MLAETSLHDADVKDNCEAIPLAWQFETSLPWLAFDVMLAVEEDVIVTCGGWDGVNTSNRIALYCLKLHRWLAASFETDNIIDVST